MNTHMKTVGPVYYGYLETNKMCPDYQGVLIFQVVLYEKVQFRKCPDHAGIQIFKCPH